MLVATDINTHHMWTTSCFRGVENARGRWTSFRCEPGGSSVRRLVAVQVATCWGLNLIVDLVYSSGLHSKWVVNHGWSHGWSLTTVATCSVINPKSPVTQWWIWLLLILIQWIIITFRTGNLFFGAGNSRFWHPPKGLCLGWKQRFWKWLRYFLPSPPSRPTP